MHQDKANLLKLSVGCRELAAALDQGETIDLSQGRVSDSQGNPCCAFGHAFVRAGFTLPPNINEGEDAIRIVTGFDPAPHKFLLGSLFNLQQSNDCAPQSERAEKVVEPLFRLAEVLETEAWW